MGSMGPFNGGTKHGYRDKGTPARGTGTQAQAQAQAQRIQAQWLAVNGWVRSEF
jgi:hypothetical protein